jgi:hypothetical protein
MHGAYKWILLADDHRCRKDLFAAKPGKFPYAGEGERLEVFASKTIGQVTQKARSTLGQPATQAGRPLMCEKGPQSDISCAA